MTIHPRSYYVSKELGLLAQLLVSVAVIAPASLYSMQAAFETRASLYVRQLAPVVAVNRKVKTAAGGCAHYLAKCTSALFAFIIEGYRYIRQIHKVQCMNNHEIWHQCKNCGEHYDLRMDGKCPKCGQKPE